MWPSGADETLFINTLARGYPYPCPTYPAGAGVSRSGDIVFIGKSCISFENDSLFPDALAAAECAGLGSMPAGSEGFG